MSLYVERMLSALRWVDTSEDNRRKDMTWAVLTSILQNMIQRPGSQTDVLATDGYVARDLGINRDTAGDAIRPLIRAGVLEDITGTPAAQKVRDARRSTEPLAENARVVRLGKGRDSAAPTPSEGNETPQQEERESAAGERDSAQLSTNVVKEPRRGSLTVGDCNYARGRSSEGSVHSLREWLETVAPTSDTWKSNALGPKAMRAYGYLLDSPRPVLPKDIRDELAIGRKRAVGLLEDLAAHQLAQRPPDGTPGWIAGPLTPSQVSSPSEAVETAHRPSQPHAEPSMTDCPDHPDGPRPGCPLCDNPGDHPVTQVTATQVAPTALKPWGWDITGRPITGPNGEQDVWRLNGCDLDWVDGRTGTTRKPCVGPGGCPPVVWEAFKKETR